MELKFTKRSPERIDAVYIRLYFDNTSDEELAEFKDIKISNCTFDAKEGLVVQEEVAKYLMLQQCVNDDEMHLDLVEEFYGEELAEMWDDFPSGSQNDNRTKNISKNCM